MVPFRLEIFQSRGYKPKGNIECNSLIARVVSITIILECHIVVTFGLFNICKTNWEPQCMRPWLERAFTVKSYCAQIVLGSSLSLCSLSLVSVRSLKLKDHWNCKCENRIWRNSLACALLFTILGFRLHPCIHAKMEAHAQICTMYFYTCAWVHT